MKTNLTLILLLGCFGIVSATGLQRSLHPVTETVPVAATTNVEASGGVTTGVRYVYIQFPGDTTRVVQLRELSTVINDKVVEYNLTPEPSTTTVDE